MSDKPFPIKPVTKLALSVRRPILGVGINDADYSTQPETSVICPYYRAWTGMLGRCYSERFQSNHPTYIGCTVCDEWHSFMAFREWMMKQDWKGKHLDKDIIQPGNKVYGPDTCSFVSVKVNNLINHRPASRGGLPTGVKKSATHGRYTAVFGVNNKQIHIGTYSTPEDASSARRKVKAQHIISSAFTQENKVFKGLLRHAALLLRGE